MYILFRILAYWYYFKICLSNTETHLLSTIYIQVSNLHSCVSLTLIILHCLTSPPSWRSFCIFSRLHVSFLLMTIPFLAVAPPSLPLVYSFCLSILLAENRLILFFLLVILSSTLSELTFTDGTTSFPCISSPFRSSPSLNHLYSPPHPELTHLKYRRGTFFLIRPFFPHL